MSGLPAIRLTEKQAAFVRAMVEGCPKDDAAAKAGYSAPTHDSCRLLATPAVSLAIRIELTRRLSTEGAPLAYRVLCELARDTSGDTPAAVRRNAAKDLLDRAGYVPPRAEVAGDTGDKAPSEMSTSELHDLVSRLETELAGRAKPVSVPPTGAPSDKPLSFLD